MKEDLVARCLWILNIMSMSLPSMKYFSFPITYGSSTEGDWVSKECFDGRKLFSFFFLLAFEPLKYFKL